MNAMMWSKLFRGAAVFLLLIILVSSFLPGGSGMSGSANLGHMIAYMLLTCASGLSIAAPRRTLGRLALLALAISVLGALIEWLQPIAGRTTSGYDLLSNEIGILLGLVACLSGRLVERGLIVRPVAWRNATGRLWAFVARSSR